MHPLVHQPQHLTSGGGCSSEMRNCGAQRRGRGTVSMLTLDRHVCNKAVHAEMMQLSACKQPVPLLLRTVRSSALAPSLNDLTTENVVALQHGWVWGLLLCCGDGERLSELPEKGIPPSRLRLGSTLGRSCRVEQGRRKLV